MPNGESKQTILVVEDDIPLLKALSHKLSQDNFTVVEATDGEEGLKAAQDNHPDLILLDILMPKMDGITMMEQLRHDEWGKNVPVILLTNLNPDSNDMEKIMTIEPSYCLIKTHWGLDEVVAKIRERLEKKP